MNLHGTLPKPGTALHTLFVSGLVFSLATFARAETPTADLASMDLSQLLQVEIGTPISSTPPVVVANPGNAADPVPDIEQVVANEIPGNSGLGKWVVGYSFRHAINEGYRQGTTNLSDADTLKLFPVVPVEIIQEAHLLSFGFMPNEKWAFQATVPFLYQSTFHLSTRVDPFTLESKGVGDVTVEALRLLDRGDGERAFLGLGLGIPTGTIEAKGDTPRGPNSQLPYAMQLGSGTFDLKPSAGWSKPVGHNGHAGVDFFGVVRLGSNDRDYTLGHRFELDAWYQHKICDGVRIKPEVDVIWWSAIAGKDPDVTRGIAPVAEPENYGGFRVDLGLTAQVDIPNTRGFLEFGIKNPVVQDLNGTQIGTEWIYSVGAQFRF